MIATTVDPNLEVMVESEVAYYLRQELGPVLVWPFVLTELRRAGNSDELLPFSYRANRRYWYAKADVERFIDLFAEGSRDAQRGIEAQSLKSCQVEPTCRKTRIRYKASGLMAPSPKNSAKTSTLH